MKTALAVLCLFLSGCDQVMTPKESAGTYQMVGDGAGGGGNAWRLDTKTGEMKRCWQGTVGVMAPSCYLAVQH